MNYSRQYIVLVVLTVAVGGFLLGFDGMVAMVFPRDLAKIFLKSGLMAMAALVFALILTTEIKSRGLKQLEGILVRK